MREKIIGKICSLLFFEKLGWLPRKLLTFWKRKGKLFLLLQKGRSRVEIESAASQYATVSEILSKAKSESHLLLLEALVALYGKMYLEMNLLYNPALELTPIVSDEILLERLWQLQSLCQIDELRDKKVACLLFHISFREHLIKLRGFIQARNATFLDLKAGTESLREICTIMNFPEDICNLVPDASSEELDRLNCGKVKKTFKREEAEIIWKKAYEQEQEL